jgi:hypothetical protein
VCVHQAALRVRLRCGRRRPWPQATGTTGRRAGEVGAKCIDRLDQMAKGHVKTHSAVLSSEGMPHEPEKGTGKGLGTYWAQPVDTGRCQP